MRHRVMVSVTDTTQHAKLLRYHGRVAGAIVDALNAAGVGLVICTHALKVGRKV